MLDSSVVPRDSGSAEYLEACFTSGQGLQAALFPAQYRAKSAVMLPIGAGQQGKKKSRSHHYRRAFLMGSYSRFPHRVLGPYWLFAAANQPRI